MAGFVERSTSFVAIDTRRRDCDDLTDTLLNTQKLGGVFRIEGDGIDKKVTTGIDCRRQSVGLLAVYATELRAKLGEMKGDFSFAAAAQSDFPTTAQEALSNRETNLA